MLEIIIDNCSLGEWDLSTDEPDEAIICVDNLMVFPCRVLMAKHNLRSRAAYASYIIPHVAKLFNTDRKKLMEKWISESFYYEVFPE